MPQLGRAQAAERFGRRPVHGEGLRRVHGGGAHNGIPRAPVRHAPAPREGARGQDGDAEEPRRRRRERHLRRGRRQRGRRRRIAGLPHARARATGHAEARRAHADVPRHEPDEAHTREGRRRRHRRGEGPRPVPNLREGARVPHLQGRRHLRDRHRGVREEPESRAGSRARVAERVESEPDWAKKSKRHPFARYAAAFEDDGRQRAGDRDDERAGGSRDGGEARQAAATG